MKINSQKSEYSYMHDPAVPKFNAGSVFTVMDAQCSLCARGASWISRNDTLQDFTIIPLQSEIGIALMRHYGMDPSDPTSWLYLENGKAHTSLDAFIRVGSRLGGVWRALLIFRVLPVFVQDTIYSCVARNRYRLFGTSDLCSLPDPEVQKRILK